MFPLSLNNIFDDKKYVFIKFWAFFFHHGMFFLENFLEVLTEILIFDLESGGVWGGGGV